MSMMRKLLLFTLITVGLGSWQATSWWARETKPAVLSGKSTPIIVTIEPGSSSQMIADRLSESRVLRSKSAWQVWTRLQGFKNRSGGFQAGSYAISPQESLPEIADEIWMGQVVTKGFTIPEGWNLRQMAAHFEEEKFFTA